MCGRPREANKRGAEETRRQRGFDWAGGWQWRGGAGGLLVLGAEKGASLKSSRPRYSRSRGRAFVWPEPNPARVDKAMNIYADISSALGGGDAPRNQTWPTEGVGGGPSMRANGLLGSARRH